MVLGEKYICYFEALAVLNLQTLEFRQQILTLRFAKQSLADGKHLMETRNDEQFQVFKAHTERYRNSPILSMQRLLNRDN